MPPKKRKPTDEPEITDETATASGGCPERLDGLAGDEGRHHRLALPVIEEGPVDWCGKVITAFLHTHSRMERRMGEVVGAHGLTIAQFDVLATLWHGEGITQQELAERLLVTKGNVVGLIDRVCQAGWVERRADPSDRRANRLYLTDHGRMRLAAASPGVAGLRAKLLGVFTVEELQQLHQLLRRLEDSTAG